ncbi:MAG: hypothetical protein ACPG61_10235 [Paracoccaceae bacterium]
MMFDHALIQAAQRRHLAATLRGLPTPDRPAYVLDLALGTGGYVIDPATQPGSATEKQGRSFTEINLLGLYHSGDDIEEAIVNWIKAAERSAPMPPQQVTPHV